MIVCNSGGSSPANDASRWRKDDPLEAKANTSACLDPAPALAAEGGALEKAAPMVPNRFPVEPPNLSRDLRNQRLRALPGRGSVHCRDLISAENNPLLSGHAEAP